MRDESDLPTIRQILDKADRIGNRPMDESKSREWLLETVRQNRAKRLWELVEGWRKNYDAAENPYVAGVFRRCAKELEKLL